jgi:hypothetical protein
MHDSTSILLFSFFSSGPANSQVTDANRSCHAVTHSGFETCPTTFTLSCFSCRSLASQLSTRALVSRGLPYPSPLLLFLWDPILPDSHSVQHAVHSVVFTLGGVHSVGSGHIFPRKGRLIRAMPFLDFGRHPLVPGTHLITPRGADSDPCRTGQGGRPGLLAKRGRRAAPSVHQGHHQGGRPAKKHQGFCPSLTHVFLRSGRTRPLTVLDGGLFTQWDVPSFRRTRRNILNCYPSQRTEVSRFVRSIQYFLPTDLIQS